MSSTVYPSHVAPLDLHYGVDNDGAPLLASSDGSQVMMAWEKPYMEALVGALEVQPFTDVLEIGFGLGFSAEAIQRCRPRSHTIIECAPAVLARLRGWASSRPGVIAVEGTWQAALPSLSSFDRVFFDDYPLATSGPPPPPPLSPSPPAGGAYHSRWHDFLDVLATEHLRPGALVTGYMAHDKVDLTRPDFRVTCRPFDVSVSPACTYFPHKTAVLPVMTYAGARAAPLPPPTSAFQAAYTKHQGERAAPVELWPGVMLPGPPVRAVSSSTAVLSMLADRHRDREGAAPPHVGVGDGEGEGEGAPALATPEESTARRARIAELRRRARK